MSLHAWGAIFIPREVFGNSDNTATVAQQRVALIKPTSSQILLHPPSQLTYSNTQNLTAASCSKASTRTPTSQSATLLQIEKAGKRSTKTVAFPGRNQRRYVTCPGRPRSSCQSPELPHPEPDLVSCARPVHESALEGTACFSTVCSREIQLVEERSAVIYLRTPSYSPEGLAAGGGGRAGGCAPRRLLRRRTARPRPGPAPRYRARRGKGISLASSHANTSRGAAARLPSAAAGRLRASPRPPRRRVPGRAVTPASRPRSAPHRGPAPLRTAPHRSARRGDGQRRLGHPAAAASSGGSADNPPATTHPSRSGMEYTKTQRKSGWTVLGAKCWKFVSATLRL